MTTSSAEIREKITFVESQRQEAERLEQARIAAETAHQREIAENEAELERLHRAELEATIQELRAQNAVLVQTYDRETAALFARLESPDLKISDLNPALLQGIGTAYNATVDHAGRLQGAIQSLAYENYDQRRAQLLQQNGGVGYLADRALESSTQGIMSQYIAGQTIAINPPDTLAIWISRANGDFDRRKRQAVAFILTGFMLNPNPDFSPRSEMLMPRQYR